MHQKINGSKEYVERRHGQPIKFLFLPKMGLLGSQASTKKKSIMNYELLLREVFSCTFFGLKIVFLGLAVLVILVIIVKGVCHP